MAKVLWDLAHQAVNLGQADQALQYLRLIHAAISDARWEPCAQTLAEAAAYEAWVHALAGREQACRRSLHTAEDHFAAGATGGLPPWRAHFTEVELTALRGHSLHVLAGHHPEVAPEAHEALAEAAAGRSDAYARAAALGLIATSATCFQGGDDLPAGVETGRRALAAVTSMDAPRILTRARALLDATAAYAGQSDVDDFRHDLLTALGPAAGRAQPGTGTSHGA